MRCYGNVVLHVLICATVSLVSVFSEQGVMEGDNFDTELFINEVEKRPSIWDMQSSEYKDRILKKRHWEEIVDICCPNGDIKEKQHVGKLLKTLYCVTYLYINNVHVKLFYLTI